MKKLVFIAILLLSLVSTAGQASADPGTPQGVTWDGAGITWESAGVTWE